MTDDLSPFNTQEILAMTAIGESESRGETGMQQTLNTVINRTKANLHWMGGNDARSVCLQPGQYDCWDAGTGDRERIISVALNNPLYAPYAFALGLAARALAGDLPDITNSAVSYGDRGERPKVVAGAQPCLIDGDRVFFDLAAVEG